MSVFSIIKRGRAQAKEHSAKLAEKEGDEAVKLPYRHVPTHAAVDAIATSPSSWKHEDRPKIKEQNRRRSAMAANGMSSRGPRTGSSLAYVSYPSANANPVVPFPRNYSYSSMPGSWREKMASTPEAVEETEYFGHPRDYKGKGKEILPTFTMGTASPVYSSGRSSPMSSRAVPVAVGVDVGVGMAVSGAPESPSYLDNERDVRKQAINNVPYIPDSRPQPPRDSSATGERLHRLHPAHARKLSEPRAPNISDRHYPPPARSTYFSAPRPSTHSRSRSADTSTLPAPAFHGQVYGHGPPSAASSVTSIGMAISTAPTSAASTPPPSNTGGNSSLDLQSFQVPAVGIAVSEGPQRRAPEREQSRASSDTVRLSSSNPPQSQAAPTRGRWFSRARPQQSNEWTPRQSAEVERQTIVNRIPMAAVSLSSPTSAQTNSLAHGPSRRESGTDYDFGLPDSALKQKHTRTKLSKIRYSSKERTSNTQTSSKSGWSLFSRRNSMGGS